MRRSELQNPSVPISCCVLLAAYPAITTEPGRPERTKDRCMGRVKMIDLERPSVNPVSFACCGYPWLWSSEGLYDYQCSVSELKMSGDAMWHLSDQPRMRCGRHASKWLKQ